MATAKPLVIVTRKLPEAIEQRLAELFNVNPNDTDHPFSKSQLLEAVRLANVLVPTVTDKIDAEIIAAAGPQLALIANFGNGIDHIDVAAAAAKNIIVTNTPRVLTEDTADMTMGLIIAVSRRMMEGARVIDSSNRWPGWSPTWMLGNRIWGKKIGIIGMGRIGTALARRARAFGLSINYHNRKPVHPTIESELQAKHWPDLDAMLREVDIISVNSPHTKATTDLLSAKRLRLLKPSAILVNTSRGKIVDEAALAEMLEDGTLAGAGLDVFANEPAVNPRLISNPRVVLLPHMGSATIEGRMEMGEKVIINIKTWVDGHKPPDRVLLSML
jgi:glyoxylate reductase